MNERIRLPRLCLLALVVPAASLVQAQTLDFGSCVRIEDLSARLACYDRAAGRTPTGAAAAPATGTAPAPVPVPAPTPQSAPAPDVAPAPASAAAPEAGFGSRSLPQKKQSDEPTKIQARVTAVRRLPRGEQVLTLENGQVWQQIEYKAEPQYEAGDVVVIRKGVLGSYLMTRATGSPTTRVKRIG